METIGRLYDIQDLPAIIADQQGIVTYVNACFRERFGWTADIIGSNLNRIIPVQSKNAWPKICASVARSS